MILKDINHRAHKGHRGQGIISFFFAPLPPVFVPLCGTTPGKLLLLLLLLAPIALSSQSPELVQAKARVKALNAQLDKLDDVIEQQLEAALAGQVDTSPKGEFETTTEHEARLAAAREARRRLELEYERKKADRRRAIEDEIEALTSVPYPAPIRIRLGTYDADVGAFPFYVRATGDSGTIDIPREVAKDVKTNLPTLKQTGWWRLLENGAEQLAVVAVAHQSGTYMGGTVVQGIKVSLLQTLTGHLSGVLAVTFSPDGKILASGSNDHTIKLWRVSDPATAGLLKTLTGHSAWVLSVAFSPDGQTLASGSYDQTIKLWRVSDPATAGLLKTLTGHSGWVRSVTFSPDGQVLASGSLDNTIKLWRVSEGRLIQTITGHKDKVWSVALSPDGHTLASGGDDNTIKLWRVKDGQLLQTLKRHGAEVYTIAFSPDGKTLASGSSGQTVKLWRVRDGRLLKTLWGHGSAVESVAFSPDGKTVASGALNETVRLWQVRDGQLLQTLKELEYGVKAVAFSPDGRILASGGFDDTIKLWRITPAVDDQFLAALRSVAGVGGAVAAKGPSLPPTLSAQVTFTEPSGDNILDANEEGTLSVTLTNTGQGSAYGIEVALTLRQAQGDVSGQVPGLSFPARRYLGEIPPGKSQKVSIPLKAGLDVADGKATITCSFTEANGFEPDPVEITFQTRAYRPPQLELADVGVDEPSGNGMIEPGEVVTVMVRVQNRGRGAAEGTKARVNIGKNVFAAAGSETEFDLGSLPPGAFKDIQFQVYTNRRAREIPVTLTLTERHGKYGQADAPLELPFNQPVRSIQQVFVEGKEGEVAVAVAVAGGLSIDIERDIPQGRDSRRDAVALVIANRRYRDPDVPDVTFAHRDGEFVKQYLVRTLGYREGNIFLYQDATLSNFRTALRKLRNAARKGSDVFVYYTGHGAPDPEDKAGYFVPVDCDPNYVKIGGVALDEFYRELGGIEAGNVTVVIDACFSGTSEAGMLIKEASPVFISVEDPAAGLKEGVVLTSASGDQISSWHPEQKHSLYTYYFLKGLQGAADTNGDRSLSVGELQAYLEEQVPYMARRLHNRTQTPTVTPGREDRVLVRYE